MRKVRSLVLLLTLATFLANGAAFAQGTKITPPKNSYSVADDVKLGAEASAEVRKQLPILPEDGDVDSYVERVGANLVQAIPPEFRHPEFRYEFSVVNAKEINAFALPGGPMFVNRGMIEAAHSEGEMAGVMAHELSHVALRHGTAQATKQGSAKVQLGAIGGAILGAIIGGNAGDVVAQGTQLGLGAYLLKYSREYETQADILGAQIMARAGYEPRDLANMFKTIEQESGGSGGPEWLSSHPNPGNRYERINQEAQKLSVARRSVDQSGFQQAQASLRRMGAAPSPRSGGSATGRSKPDAIGGNVEPPSNRYRAYESNLFRVSVPSNWQEFADRDSVTFAPRGAYGEQNGQSIFTHGAIVGVSQVSRGDLATVNEQYISGLLRNNSYLSAEGRSRRTTLDGQQAMATTLSGRSEVTGRTEIVNVYTAMANNGLLFHVVLVSPENEFRQYRGAFDTMVRSVRFAR
jgi:Zn-dependent protease with chaperone function